MSWMENSKEMNTKRGIAISNAKIDVNRKLRKKDREKRQKGDTNNRKYVFNKIQKYMKEEGLNKQQALDKIMQDPIVNEFEYLKNNGLDIRKCFENWIDSALNREKTRQGLER